MARDIERLLKQGITFKKGKDEDVIHKSIANYTGPKRKGETISGAAKMKAAYKARKRSKTTKKK